MIQFSALLLLYVYLAMGAVLIAISIGHLWHAVRFGGLHAAAVFTSGLFIAGIITIVWSSYTLLTDVDWSGIYVIDLPAVKWFGAR